RKTGNFAQLCSRHVSGFAQLSRNEGECSGKKWVSVFLDAFINEGIHFLDGQPLLQAKFAQDFAEFVPDGFITRITGRAFLFRHGFLSRMDTPATTHAKKSRRGKYRS